jgi:hypothetical protein
VDFGVHYGTVLNLVLKQLGKFLVDNWKPLAGTVMDGIVASQPEAAPLRGLVKSITGVGLDSRRKLMAGGSFRLS